MQVAEELVRHLMPNGATRVNGEIDGEISSAIFTPHHMFGVLGLAIPRASREDLEGLFGVFADDSGAADVRELLYGLATRRPTTAEKRMHVMRVNALEEPFPGSDEDERKHRRDDNDSRGGGDGGTSTPPDDDEAGAGQQQ